MNDSTVLWRPHAGAQTRFLQSSAYEALYGGAAGGGKTDALLYGLLRQTHNPHYRGLFLRESFPQLREVVDRAHQTLPQLGGDWRATEYRYHFPSGSTIEFGYCATMADTPRYQGQEYTAIAYDELGQCPDENVWTFLMSRNRTTHDGLVLQMRASANPGGRGHGWLKRRFVTFCPVDGTQVIDPRSGLTRAYVPAKLTDNPTLMAKDPGYRMRLEGLPDVMRQQLLYGDWDAGAGLYFSELNEDVHFLRVPAGKLMLEPWWPLWGSFDWGFNHPFAAGAFTVNDDGQIIVIETVHGRRMYPADIAMRVRKSLPKPALMEVYAGHDCFAKRRALGGDPPSVADVFLEHDVNLMHANIDRVLGWDVLRRLCAIPRDDAGNLLAPKMLFVDTPSNKKTFENLRTAVSDPDDPEDVLKEDANEQGEGGDDPRDMMRYGVSIRAFQGTRPTQPEPRFEQDRATTTLLQIGEVGQSEFATLPDGF